MKETDFRYVRVKMEGEGFHYCFKHYSEFNEVDDEEFHRLREAYLEAADKLEQYVNTKAKEEENNDWEGL